MSVLEERIWGHREIDTAARSTTVGPHRDDFEVVEDGRPVRAFAFHGQRRAAALAMRSGVAALPEALTGNRPLLLLDDVLSELDARSRGGAFEARRSAEQAALASADPEGVSEEARREGTLHEVRDGQLV